MRRAALIQRPPRGENGYRLYAPETVDVLRFIKQPQGLGLTLGEIKDIVAIRRRGRARCAHVHQLLESKTVELDRKLKDLLMLRRRLRQSLAAWGRTSGKRRSPFGVPPDVSELVHCVPHARRLPCG